MQTHSCSARLLISIFAVFILLLTAAVAACQRSDSSVSGESGITSAASDRRTDPVSALPSAPTQMTTTKAPETVPAIPVTTDRVPESTSAPIPSVTTTAPPIPSVTTTAPPISSVTTTAVERPLITDSPLVEAVLREAAEKYGAVGIQVAVISGGRVGATAEYGWAVKDERLMAQDTKIRVASLTKTLIGMITFRLIEDGKLELDADISEYIGVDVRNPAYPDDPITLRMLLTHTSSMKNVGYVTSLSGLQKQLQKESTFQNYRPGEKFAYNNFAIGVLGAICEIVTGQPMNTLVKEYFFEPMGIVASLAPSELDASSLAVIYNSSGEVGRSIEAQQSIELPTAPVQHMR
ncbi:MAG: serine hydrolase, partial [Clostridia bacterium]|nr:serine hydrolase [Clostridia bacterium]